MWREQIGLEPRLENVPKLVRRLHYSGLHVSVVKNEIINIEGIPYDTLMDATGPNPQWFNQQLGPAK